MKQSFLHSDKGHRMSTTSALFQGQDGHREIKRLGLGEEWKELAKHNYRMVETIS